jgi:hypothetical protein
MSRYQQNADGVAAPRLDPETDALRHEAFMRDVQSLARRLYLSCPNASTADKDFLQDVARGRYAMKATERLIRIGQLSYRPEHRLAVAALAEQWANADSQLPPSVYEAFNEETMKQGEADLAQRAFEHFPTKTGRERVLEALTAQLVATRNAIRAVVAAPVR